MKALIIEDEKPAARHLLSVLKEVGQMEVLAVLDSIKSSVQWLKENEQPGLIFMDIHIADGSAFMIFEQVSITCPVIFTTAYDEYALKAFKVNSIDYLLKPITLDDVEKALAKLHTLTVKKGMSSEMREMIRLLKQENSYKTHFLVEVKGSKMVPLQVREIAFFYTDSGKVSARTLDERSFPMDSNLDELASKLNPTEFFRANRQFIISRAAIRDVDWWFNQRLSVNLKVTAPEKILISRTRVTEFRHWFTGE